MNNAGRICGAVRSKPSHWFHLTDSPLFVPCLLCRWCAEGGNLICCDYCSNAFCKKCILRNLGRKELSGILESQWYCYVCSPEPIFGLVSTCNNILENIEALWHQQRKKNRAEPEKSELFGMLPSNIPLDKWDHTDMDGNVVFNYNTLQVSKEITKKTKHLVESTNTVNRAFVHFIHSVTDNKQTASVRSLYLKSFLSVVRGIRRSLAALELSLKEEFSDLDVLNCWDKLLSDEFDTQTVAEGEPKLDGSDERCLNDLQKLAGEHLNDDDSNWRFATESPAEETAEERDTASQKATHCAQAAAIKPSESSVNMTKKLVVKLTPVPLKQAADAPKMAADVCLREKKLQGKTASEHEDTTVACAKPESRTASSDNAPPHAEEEQGNRRSPRVKTTPLRRPSDVKAKPPLSTADSDSDPEETPSSLLAKDAEEQCLSRARDDSDSDEVPAALLERAAMAQSSDEHQSDENAGSPSTKVAKKCLFWLTKNSPMSTERICHKRKMMEHPSESKVEPESGTDSSDQEPPHQRQRLRSLRSIRETYQRKGEGSEGGKPGTVRMRKTKTRSCQEVMDSTSSSSDDEQNDESGSNGDDQKIQPITEHMSLLGAAAFHQSSGEFGMCAV